METHIRLSLAYLEGTANSIYSKQDAPSFPCHQHLLLFFSISIQSIIGSHSPGQNPDTFCDSSLSPPPVLVSSRLYSPARPQSYHPSTQSPIHPSTHLSVHLPYHPFIYQFIHSHVHPSTYPMTVMEHLWYVRHGSKSSGHNVNKNMFAAL